MAAEPITTVRIQLKDRYLPYLVGILFILQIFFPYKGWMFLLITMGGLWGLSYWWALSLACGSRIVREQRFGWKIFFTSSSDVACVYSFLDRKSHHSAKQRN